MQGIINHDSFDDLIGMCNPKNIDSCDSGYDTILFTVAKFCGLIIPTFPSAISTKEMADTICCGPPFVFRIEDILIYPEESPFLFVTFITENWSGQSLFAD